MVNTFFVQLADIPDAEIKPPENVLFVCKLNPVTQVSVSSWLLAACLPLLHFIGVFKMYSYISSAFVHTSVWFSTAVPTLLIILGLKIWTSFAD